MDEEKGIYLGQELRMILDRPEYIDRIIPFLDKPVIKVITGMRRVGKSRLLELVRDHLVAQGVGGNHPVVVPVVRPLPGRLGGEARGGEKKESRPEKRFRFQSCFLSLNGY